MVEYFEVLKDAAWEEKITVDWEDGKTLTLPSRAELAERNINDLQKQCDDIRHTSMVCRILQCAVNMLLLALSVILAFTK